MKVSGPGKAVAPTHDHRKQEAAASGQHRDWADCFVLPLLLVLGSKIVLLESADPKFPSFPQAV